MSTTSQQNNLREKVLASVTSQTTHDELAYYKTLAKSLEIELAQQLTSADNQETQLFNNIAHGSLLIHYHDEKPFIALTNTSLQQQVGYTTSELQNTSLDDILTPKDKRKALKAFAHFKQGKTPEEEIELKQKNGQYAWAKLSFKPYGEATQVNLVDITAEKEYELMKKKLRHDSTNLLHGVTGFTGEIPAQLIHETVDELMKGHYNTVLKNINQLEEYVGIANKQALKTIDFIQELGNPSPARKISLYELVEDFKSSYEPSIDIAIENNVDENLAITTNPLLVYEILQNVTSNAHKYAREGEKITIETSVNNEQLSLIMRDYGTEKIFSEQDINKLFETGVQLDNGLGKGTGEGLYIVAQTAKKLGGTISVRQLARGHEFKLDFPNEYAA